MSKHYGAEFPERFLDSKAKSQLWIPLAPAKPHPHNGMLLYLEDGVEWPGKQSGFVNTTPFSVPLACLYNCEQEEDVQLPWIKISEKSFDELWEHIWALPRFQEWTHGESVL
jgi:hypothetical protein